MAVPLAQSFDPLAVVYDSMDELSAFLNAPRELLEREEQLFQMADVVFTGGPSLYRAKKDRHPNVHCFPSSVDAKHFGQARTAPRCARPVFARTPPFRILRRDRRKARCAPGGPRSRDRIPNGRSRWWDPVVKIDPQSLPQHPNLHYFGQRKYEELPHFLAGWDVCCCRSPATKPRASSAPPRRSNTWRPSGRSSALRSRMWPNPTGRSCTWATRRRNSSRLASER